MSKRRRKRRIRTALQKIARKGFRGYPVATVAYYGPDDQFASKVAVGIMLQKDGDVAFLERWFSQKKDVRTDPTIVQEIVAFISQHQARSVAMTDGIIGCPHEEGIDYPEGKSCPQCPYWAGHETTRPPEVRTVMGYAWYRAEQWDRLREVAVDRDKLAETHAEWVASAEESLREMRKRGIHADKVEVDVEELLTWCKARDLKVDSGARAQYAAKMLHQRLPGSRQ